MGGFRVAALAAAAALWAGSASAAIVFVETTLDVTQGQTFSSGLTSFQGDDFGPIDVQLSEGDTLDWTIRLLQGQSITLEDASFITTSLHPDYNGLDHLPQGTFLTALGPQRLQFLGPNDNVVADLTANQVNVSGSRLTGLFYENNDIRSVDFPSPVTFSALRVVIGLGDYTNVPETTLTYRSASLSLVDRADFVPPPPVPEPTTWALLILGFGTAGAALRRRQAASRLES
jgi:hypothetical protein